MIRSLFDAGVDMFRLNFSHVGHEDHRKRFDAIRAIERDVGRPIGIMMDLQGPKLRVGSFADGPVELSSGDRFRLDLDTMPGDRRRVPLPHPEIFAALTPGTDLLLDDGKLRLEVRECGPRFAETRVKIGGRLSERKGVNVSDVILPLSPLTEKDRRDLDFGLELGVDWVALSFVQRAEDIAEARALIGSRAMIMAKLEKPAAIDDLDAIVAPCGWRHGCSRRPPCRTAAGTSSYYSTSDCAGMPSRGETRRSGDANARIDDDVSGGHPGRSLRRCDGGLRR